MPVSGSQKIQLSTVVMAHPARREQAEQLQRRHPELDIQIVLDPDPTGPPATLRTSRLAWSRVPEGASHHLVLQEDVLLCDGFAEAVRRAVSLLPETPLALFANWVMWTSQALRLAALAGASWTPVVDEWTPTQALVLPAPLAREFAEFTESLSVLRPDNRAMSAFLDSKGLTTQVCIPNLVEHRPTGSLLLNDLLYGVREATVFSVNGVTASTITDQIVAPAAIAQLGVSGVESFCHYEPVLRGTSSLATPAHELLVMLGLSNAELAEGFASDLDHHREAQSPYFGKSFLFQFWLAGFVQGIIARGLLLGQGMTDLQSALDRHPWALPALATFPAGALRRVPPADSLHEVAQRFVPFCLTALRSGFAAPDYWPDLKTMWQPDEHVITPRWNNGLA